MQNKHINSCIWSVALYGSETWTVGKNVERVINAFETWCWRRVLKIKRADRITNGEVFQKVKKEKLLFKILKNRRHSWIGHTIRHNEFVVNILEGAISGKKAVGRPRLRYLKQVARNTAADSCTAMNRMACNKSRWKAANQSRDWGISRRRKEKRKSVALFTRGRHRFPSSAGWFHSVLPRLTYGNISSTIGPLPQGGIFLFFKFAKWNGRV